MVVSRPGPAVSRPGPAVSQLAWLCRRPRAPMPQGLRPSACLRAPRAQRRVVAWLVVSRHSPAALLPQSRYKILYRDTLRSSLPAIQFCVLQYNSLAYQPSLACNTKPSCNTIPSPLQYNPSLSRAMSRYNLSLTIQFGQ